MTSVLPHRRAKKRSKGGEGSNCINGREMAIDGGEREREKGRQRALIKMMARASHRDPESKCTGVASGVNE